MTLRSNLTLGKLLTALIALLLLPVLGFAQNAEPAGPQPTTPETMTADSMSDDPVLVQVGSSVERLSDLQWRFDVLVRNVAAQEGLPFTPEVEEMLQQLLPSYLSERAQELTLLQEVARRGIEPNYEEAEATIAGLRDTVSSDEFQALLDSAGFENENQVRTMLIEADVINQLVNQIREEAAAAATPGALKARYLAERQRFTEGERYCARHILVADKELAVDLLAQLEDGADFAELAAEHGTDGTSSRGGDLGCFGLGAMIPEFEEAVIAAPLDEAVGPVESQFGYHLILVYDHMPARVLPYNEVEDQVREFVVALETDADIRGLLQGAGAMTFPERLPALD